VGIPQFLTSKQLGQILTLSTLSFLNSFRPRNPLSSTFLQKLFDILHSYCTILQKVFGVKLGIRTPAPTLFQNVIDVTKSIWRKVEATRL